MRKKPNKTAPKKIDDPLARLIAHDYLYAAKPTVKKVKNASTSTQTESKKSSAEDELRN